MTQLPNLPAGSGREAMMRTGMRRGPGSHTGGHTVYFWETEGLSIVIMRSKKQSHKPDMSLSKEGRLRQQEYVSCLSVGPVGSFEGFSLFLPNVKTVPKYIVDLWVKDNNYFSQSMSFMIQSATLQLTEGLVKSTNHLLFMAALFHKHSSHKAPSPLDLTSFLYCNREPLLYSR